MAVKKTSPSIFPHPIDCEKIVGHTDFLKTFMTAWDNRDTHPLHPVWILSGPKGIGKATLAYRLAKQIYGNIGDFFVLDIEHNIDKDGKSKTDSKTISVFTVREMIKKLQVSSMSGGWRVVLVDSVDELRMPEAGNAMLKILEEPPAKTIFFLISNQLANALPTIRSRARIEKLRPLTKTNIQQLCLTYMPESEINDDIINLCNGSFGKIAHLIETGGDKIYIDLLNLLNNKKSTAADIMALSEKIAVSPELYPLLTDAIAHFGLADLYPVAAEIISDMATLNIEARTSIFKIITKIKQCL